MFKNDNIFTGIILGLILTGIVFGILFIINKNIVHKITESTIFLLSVAVNIISMRYFLINKQLDKIGKGILLVTFIFAIIYIAFYLD